MVPVSDLVGARQCTRQTPAVTASIMSHQHTLEHSEVTDPVNHSQRVPRTGVQQRLLEADFGVVVLPSSRYLTQCGKLSEETHGIIRTSQ